jgi:DNA modification methylase
VSFLILNADARQIPLKDNSVQCVVTSPPYWAQRDYEVDRQIGLERRYQDFIEAIVSVFIEVHRVLKSDGVAWVNLGDCYHSGDRGGYRHDGHRWEKSEIQKHNRGNATTIRPNRLLQEGLKDKDLCLIPFRVAIALQSSGWWYRQTVIWSKLNPMTESVKDRPTTSHEYVFLISKSQRYFYDAEAISEPQSENERTRRLREQASGLSTKYNLRRDAIPGQNPPGANGCAKSVEARQRLAQKGTRNRRSVWEFSTQQWREDHFATMPEDLAELCIKAGSRPGDIVLDPFAGAGTTLLVADKLNRFGIGLELKKEYCDMAQRRCFNDAPLLASTL